MDIFALENLRTVLEHGVPFAERDPSIYEAAGSFAAFCSLEDDLNEAAVIAEFMEIERSGVKSLYSLTGPCKDLAGTLNEAVLTIKAMLVNLRSKELKNEQSANQSAPPMSRTAGKKTDSGKGNAPTDPANDPGQPMPSGEDLALASLFKNPEWTETKRAEYLGISRSTLYRYPKYKNAKDALKTGKEERQRGSKYKGQLDSY